MIRRTSRASNTEPQPAGKAAVGWVMTIYFCSGVCSLIDEVVWVRLIKLTLGNTVYASSIVVSVFMGGLALGALIMSRYADGVRNRLRLYAALEMLATISAVSMPWALKLADRLYRWFYAAYPLSPAAMLFMQIAVSALLLLIPTMVMGSTLPLLGRYVTALKDRAGGLVGRLYALNMLGAALGCLLAGFYLIKTLGVMGTLYTAAAINLFVALGGLVLSRTRDRQPESTPPEPVKDQPAAAGAEESSGRTSLLMMGLFCSGLVSIGYEIIWMRTIVFLVGGFTYVFSAVLTLYLLGNVIGAAIGAALSKRLREPALGFGISLTCLGVLGIVYLPWLNTWSFRVAPNLLPGMTKLLGALNLYAESTTLPLLHSLFLFLIPSVAMGIGFPLALQAYARARRGVGQTTGRVYAVNTIGAVMGGVVTGFVLIPMLGAQIAITVLGLAVIGLGGTMLQTFRAGASVRWRILSAGLILVLFILAIRIPLDQFRKNFVAPRNEEALAIREGLTTTVTVARNSKGNLILSSDNIPIGGDGAFRVPQKVLGHLGMLLNRDAGEILSVGFGTGETTACLAAHEPASIDCVEIARELTECGLEFFPHINLGDRLEDKVSMIYTDAKNFLHLTPGHYDLILNDADLPFLPGSAPIFAREHFQRALERLHPGGLFITKMHINMVRLSRTGFDSILGTFMDVFPHVTIWYPVTKSYSMFYLVGSKDPQIYSPEYIEKKLQNEAVRRSVAYLNFRSSLDVLSCYIGDKEDLTRYLKTFHMNSDYSPYVEFHYSGSGLQATPEMIQYVAETWLPDFVALVRSDSLSRHLDWAGLSDAQREAWREAYAGQYEASTYALRSFSENNPFAILENSFRGLRRLRDYPVLLQQEEMALSTIRMMIERGGARRMIRAIDDMIEEYPDMETAWLLKSWSHQRKGELPQALDAARKAVSRAPGSTRARENLDQLQRLSK